MRRIALPLAFVSLTSCRLPAEQLTVHDSSADGFVGSDDLATPTVDVAPEDVAAAPVIVLDPRTLDFGIVGIGCVVTQVIAVQNGGDAALVLEQPPEFTASNPRDIQFFAGPDYTVPTAVLPFPLAIEPGGAANFQVIYAPLDDTDDSAMVTVESNDPVQPQTRATQTGAVWPAEWAEDRFEQSAPPAPFVLSNDPVEETIEVYVDDQQWNQGWWYTGHEVEDGSNAVEFAPKYVPAAGVDVRIEYAVRGDCVPS